MLASTASAEEYNKSYTVAHRADVRVHADESSVRIVTSDSKQVEFHVRYEGFTAIQVGNKLHVDSQQSGDRLDLTVQISPGITLGFSNRTISTEVRMPRDADLLIETSDGAIEASAIDGQITLHTKDGGVKVWQLSGHIDLQTSDGGIRADNLKGECMLQTSDGTVTALNVDGKLTAASKDGSIRAAGRFDFLDLETADGSVRARIGEGSKMASAWNIRTKDGSVTVSLPSDFPANLDVGTRDGSVGVELPVTVQGQQDRKHLRGTIDGGGPLLSVQTLSGSVRIIGL